MVGEEDLDASQSVMAMVKRRNSARLRSLGVTLAEEGANDNFFSADDGVESDWTEANSPALGIGKESGNLDDLFSVSLAHEHGDHGRVEKV